MSRPVSIGEKPVVSPTNRTDAFVATSPYAMWRSFVGEAHHRTSVCLAVQHWCFKDLLSPSYVDAGGTRLNIEHEVPESSG